MSDNTGHCVGTFRTEAREWCTVHDQLHIVCSKDAEIAALKAELAGNVYTQGMVEKAEAENKVLQSEISHCLDELSKAADFSRDVHERFEKAEAEVSRLRLALEQRIELEKVAMDIRIIRNHRERIGVAILNRLDEALTKCRYVALASPQQARGSDRCSKCKTGIILADTEDWKKPLCHSCYIEAGEKEKP